MTANNNHAGCNYHNHPLFRLLETFYGTEMAEKMMADELGVPANHCSCKGNEHDTCKTNNAEVKFKEKVCQNNEKVLHNECKAEHMRTQNAPTASHAVRGGVFTYGASNIAMGEDGHYHISILLPGFKKENIDVSYKGKTLTVTASISQTVADCDEKEACVHKSVSEEFRYAENVKRVFNLNNPVFEQAKMSFEDGVLKITVPAKQPEEAKKLHF